MARRRNYKRDQKGRFARVSGAAKRATRPSGKSAPSGRRALAASAAYVISADAVANASRASRADSRVGPSSKAVIALHGAKLATTGTRQGIKYAKRRTKSKKRQEQLKKADGIVEVIDRAVNIALLGAVVGAVGGTKVGQKASRPFQQRQNRLMQQQKRALGR